MTISILEVIVYIFEHTLSFTTVCAIIVVIFQRKEPKSTCAWLLVLYFVPIFGFPIYLLAGTDMHRRKLFRVKEIEDRLSEVIRQQEYRIVNKNHDQIEKKLWQYSDLIYYNLENSGSVITENKKVTIYTDGNDLYRELKEDLKKATQSIHMQYYIIRNDILFQQIVDILKKKVKEGVEVRILYDGMGCAKVSKRFWRSLEENGIEFNEDICLKTRLGNYDGNETLDIVYAMEPRPDGIICINDTIFYGMILSARERNIPFTNDFQIGCFTDKLHRGLISSKLSVLTHPSYEMGTKSAEKLIELIKNGSQYTKKEDVCNCIFTATR